MNRFKNLLTLVALLLLSAVVALAILNWPALNAVVTWHLGFTEVQWPIGAAMLLLAAGLFVPLAMAHLRHVIGTIIDTRRMVADVRRLQKLADQAEASRIEALREYIGSEFGRLQARLDAWPIGGQGADARMPNGPAGLGDAIVGEARVVSPRATALSRWFRPTP